MRHRILLIVNGSVILFVFILLIGHFTSAPSTAQESFIQPAPATERQSATHLTYVVFDETESGQVTTAAVTQSLDQNGQARITQAPEVVSSQPEPVMCQTDSILDSCDLIFCRVHGIHLPTHIDITAAFLRF